MREPLVQLSHVSKTFTSRDGQRRVLEDISFQIDRGERVALVGPNGSGKTTLLRIVLGIEHPDEGSIVLNGADTKYCISYVPQDYRNALFPWLRLSANIALANGNRMRCERASGGEAKPIESTTEYSELAERFHLPLDISKYPYQLSGGEQQIFLLMRAMLAYPVLMLLDEPMSAVDFGRKRLILQHLASWIPKRNISLIFASHDFEEAVMLADRVHVFARRSGRLKATVEVDLPWPRTLELRQDIRFRSLVDQVTSAIL
jgi:NitT/TauT family transport system ATP-binding protein